MQSGYYIVPSPCTVIFGQNIISSTIYNVLFRMYVVCTTIKLKMSTLNVLSLRSMIQPSLLILISMSHEKEKNAHL